MSIRRKAGDWVWLPRCSGFINEANRLRAEIQPESEMFDPFPCMLNCGDPECREWVELRTEPDPEYNGKRHVLYHISECEMNDTPQL